MDDFGKGESNFVRLMDFEFQSIKLDKGAGLGHREQEDGHADRQTLLVFCPEEPHLGDGRGIETREQAAQLEKLRRNFYRAT